MTVSWPNNCLRRYGGIANRRAGFDDSVRLNGNACAKFDIRGDDRRGVNPGGKSNWLGREFEHHLLERLCRIGDANLCRGNFLGKILRDKSGRSARLSQQRQVGDSPKIHFCRFASARKPPGNS